MGKKRLLNVTSRKKRNGMLTWTNTSSQGGTSVTPGPGSLIVNGRDACEMVWCPTAMDLSGSNGASTVAQVPLRTASTCFMKGLSENIRLFSNTGAPWFHRRICFTYKGITPFRATQSADTPVNAHGPFVETSSGMERLAFNLNVNNELAARTAMWGVLFKGANGKDWNNLLIAPVDTSRVSLKFDKLWTYRSGNANGVVATKKLWHPMNKNLVYDDDENGDVEQESYFSVNSKAGMGDYYVVDFISCATGGTASDILTIDFNSTMYWHEK